MQGSGRGEQCLTFLLRWNHLFHANGNQNRAGVTILKNTLYIKTCYKRQGILFNDKGISLQRRLTIINIYAPNLRASTHTKQLWPN